MRIDKFMNVTNILKTRSLAQDMCDSGAIKLNGTITKQSKEVKIGDIISLIFLDSIREYKVLDIPTLKSIKKSQSHLYAQEISKDAK